MPGLGSKLGWLTGLFMPVLASMYCVLCKYIQRCKPRSTGCQTTQICSGLWTSMAMAFQVMVHSARPRYGTAKIWPMGAGCHRSAREIGCKKRPSMKCQFFCCCQDVAPKRAATPSASWIKIPAWCWMVVKRWPRV